MFRASLLEVDLCRSSLTSVRALLCTLLTVYNCTFQPVMYFISWTVLYFSVLWHTVFHSFDFSVLQCSFLYCTFWHVLWCTLLFCTILHYLSLIWMMLHSTHHITALNCTAIQWTILKCNSISWNLLSCRLSFATLCFFLYFTSVHHTDMQWSALFRANPIQKKAQSNLVK